MPDKPAARPTIPNDESPTLFEVNARLFMRASGVVLLGTAVFHLIYMQFIIPGGVTAIDYSIVAARWTDPAWGFFWRLFDLLLLVFGLTHSSNGIRNIINSYVSSPPRRKAAKILLLSACLLLAAMGAIVIFSFNPQR